MKKERYTPTFYVCIIICILISSTPTPLFSVNEEEIELEAVYENTVGREINRFIKDGDNRLFAIGPYTQLFDISDPKSFNLIKEVRNWGEGANYEGRDGYILGDYLYVIGRSNGYGEIYNKKPQIMLDFEDNISDFSKTKGPFDQYETIGDSFIDELGIPNPNVGLSSARLFSRNNNEAILEKSIESTDEAYISLWMNVENVSDTKFTNIPILKSDIEVSVSLKVRKYKYNKLQLSLLIGEDEVTFPTELHTQEWFCLKIHVNPEEKELWYRTKECGDWISLIKETNKLNLSFSKLCIGCSSESESLIYVDDIYYHPTNIDKVSYINGKFTIYDKNTLRIVNYLNLDVRPNTLQVRGNFIFLSCLRGINIYDISIPNSPVLIYTYRRDKYIECQGTDIFENNGRVYLLVSLYREGTAIFDITDPKNTFHIKDIAIRTNSEWQACNTFGIVCQYPYAYSTFTVFKNQINTPYDKRGVLLLDLSDINNVSQQLIEIPKDVKPDITTDGDTKPNRLSLSNNYLYLNNSTEGFLVFHIDENGYPQYCLNKSVPGKSVVNAISAFEDGTLFVGDSFSDSKDYPDLKIYRYKIKDNISSGIDNIKYSQNTVYFDLNGVKLKNKPSTKGIYLYNGKKYIVK